MLQKAGELKTFTVGMCRCCFCKWASHYQQSPNKSHHATPVKQSVVYCGIAEGEEEEDEDGEEEDFDEEEDDEEDEEEVEGEEDDDEVSGEDEVTHGWWWYWVSIL